MKLLVVNYHYFGDEQYTSGIYPIDGGAFTKQLNEISKYYTFISQQELVSCFTTNTFPKGNYCLITFDDGLKQQMKAFEQLQSLNIPAIFYVPTQPLIDNIILDVHKIQLIRTKLSDADMLLEMKKNGSYAFTDEDLTRAKNQYKYDDDLAREVKFQLNFKLTNSEKNTLLNKLFHQYVGEEKSYSKEFYMNTSELIALAKKGQLGSHGHAHTPLALNPNATDDISKSINYLQYITQKPIQSFSYPYGSVEAVNTSTAEVINKLGLSFALTMWRGINEIDTTTNPFLLNRIDTNDAPGGKKNSTQFAMI